jgi:hypothetical protein
VSLDQLGAGHCGTEMAADAECPGNNTYSLLFLFQSVLPIIKILWKLTIEIEEGFKWITKKKGTKKENSTPTIAVQTAVKKNSRYIFLSVHTWHCWIFQSILHGLITEFAGLESVMSRKKYFRSRKFDNSCLYGEADALHTEQTTRKQNFVRARSILWQNTCRYYGQ